MFVPLGAALLASAAPSADTASIKAAVDGLVAALTLGDRTKLDPLIEADGSLVIVDRRDPAKPRIRLSSLAKLRSEISPNTGMALLEQLGTPTILQRGDIAQYWVPYAFAVNGKPRHCGIDNFMLVRRDGNWRVAGFTYTVEALDQCAAIGAPEFKQSESPPR